MATFVPAGAERAAAQQVDNTGDEMDAINALLRGLESDAGSSGQAASTATFDAGGETDGSAQADDSGGMTDFSFEGTDSRATGSTPATGDTAVTAREIDYGRVMPVKPAGPVQSGPAATSREDPYAPLGIDLGSFVLRPTAEFGLGWLRETSNSQSGTPPTITETTTSDLLGDASLRLQVDSDWSRHALSAELYGRLQRDLDDEGELDPEGTADVTMRLDLGERTTLTGNAGYSYLEDDPQSAAFFAARGPGLTGTNDPATEVFDGSITLRHEAGLLFGEAEASAEHTMYGSAELSDGSVISQDDLDNTLYDGRLRLGLNLSPVLKPFIEGEYGVRRMDSVPDSGGYNRDATRYAVRGGVEFDYGEKLSGEVAAGYIAEDIEDAALGDLAGVAIDAGINWSPRRGTGINANFATTTETGFDAASSGAVVYAATLGVTHRLRANITGDAAFTTSYRDAQGGADETTYRVQGGLTYWLNRNVGLSTRLAHQRTTSADPLEEDQSTSAFVGLKLRR